MVQLCFVVATKANTLKRGQLLHLLSRWKTIFASPIWSTRPLLLFPFFCRQRGSAREILFSFWKYNCDSISSCANWLDTEIPAVVYWPTWASKWTMDILRFDCYLFLIISLILFLCIFSFFYEKLPWFHRERWQHRQQQRLDIRGRVKVLHGQNRKTEEPPLALFAICTPFGPPSLLELPHKESMFKSKHRLDLALVSMDQR